MDNNYAVINGNKIQLTAEQIKMLQPSPFNRAENDKYYYSINSYGEVTRDIEKNLSCDNNRFNCANYCTDESLMQQRAWHETLNRLLWRFSMENGGDEIDWEDIWQKRYHFCYNCREKEWWVGSVMGAKHLETYFISKEIAQRAVDEIVKPFMEQHPEFVF